MPRSPRDPRDPRDPRPYPLAIPSEHSSLRAKPPGYWETPAGRWVKETFGSGLPEGWARRSVTEAVLPKVLTTPIDAGGLWQKVKGRFKRSNGRRPNGPRDSQYPNVEVNEGRWIRAQLALSQHEPEEEIVELAEEFYKQKNQLKRKLGYTPDIFKEGSTSARLRAFLEEHSTVKRLIRPERAYAESTVIYESPDWFVVMPHSVEASCFWGAGTTWCTARLSGSNLFYNHVARSEENIILYYVIDKVNTEGPSSKISLGFLEGALAHQGDGQITVDADNKDPGPDGLEDIFDQEYEPIMDALQAHADSVAGQHPAKTHLRALVDNPEKFLRFWKALDKDGKQDFEKVLIGDYPISLEMALQIFGHDSRPFGRWLGTQPEYRAATAQLSRKFLLELLRGSWADFIERFLPKAATKFRTLPDDVVLLGMHLSTTAYAWEVVNNLGRDMTWGGWDAGEQTLAPPPFSSDSVAQLMYNTYKSLAKMEIQTKEWVEIHNPEFGGSLDPLDFPAHYSHAQASKANDARVTQSYAWLEALDSAGSLLDNMTLGRLIVEQAYAEWEEWQDSRQYKGADFYEIARVVGELRYYLQGILLPESNDFDADMDDWPFIAEERKRQARIIIDTLFPKHRPNRRFR